MNSRLRTALFPTLFGILFAATALAAQQSSPEQAPAAAKVATTPVTVFKTRINQKDGAVMIFIPAGSFLMGDSDQKNNPRHKVTLSGYWIYKNLVTVGMYKKFCQETGKQMPPSPHINPTWSNEDHPIVFVSWNDAAAYCAWAGVALPTDAQWEKAARGTDGRKFPWGNKFDSDKVWASKRRFGDAGETHRVGELGVSPYECTDMAGNTWQWCQDWYDAGFWGGRQSNLVDPVNEGTGAEKYRVIRGGAWEHVLAAAFRSSCRGTYVPESTFGDCGFRCAAAL